MLCNPLKRFMVKQMKRGFLNNFREKQGTLPNKCEKTQCSICLCEIKRRKLATLHDKKGKRICKHVYCNSCIKQWSKTANTCPQCRAPFHQIIAKREITKIKEPKTQVFNCILDLLLSLMHSRSLRMSFFAHYLAGHQATRDLWANVLAPLTNEFIRTYNQRHEVAFEEQEQYQNFFLVAMMMGLPPETTTIAI